jgi:predicted amidophosphoribosyltransferase
MKILTLNCPNCGAPFSPPTEKNSCFCANCGTKMIIDDGQVFVNINIFKKTENITRLIDDAKIEKQKQKTERIARWQYVTLLIGSFGFFLAIIWLGLRYL